MAMVLLLTRLDACQGCQMSTIYSSRIDVSQVKQLTAAKAVKLSDSQIAEMRKMKERMYTRPVGPPDNAPENIYATVKVAGKVVATLYNGGGSETSNAVGAKLGDMLMHPDGAGPQLAQSRAEMIAKALGGTIEKAPTAQTQAQWNARPPRQYYIDTAAMAADPWLNPSATSQVNAQLLAQEQDIAA
jgi:hypothetical protein